MTETKHETETDFPSASSLPQMTSTARAGQVEANSRFTPCGRGLGTWTTISCLPRYISRSQIRSRVALQYVMSPQVVVNVVCYNTKPHNSYLILIFSVFPSHLNIAPYQLLIFVIALCCFPKDYHLGNNNDRVFFLIVFSTQQ